MEPLLAGKGSQFRCRRAAVCTAPTGADPPAPTVRDYYPAFKAHLTAQGSTLPPYVEQAFEDSLQCGRLEHGFLRVCCDSCHTEHLVAFSCKRRFCPSCGARRMVESAALLVDEVFPEQPVRQWVLSVPYPLRFLSARRPEVMGRVLGIVYRCIATRLLRKAGLSRKTAQTRVVRRDGLVPR